MSSSGSEARGGAIYGGGEIYKIAADFINNYAISEGGTAQGGAIYASGQYRNKEDQTQFKGIINSNFLNNYTKVNSGTAQGGAIYLTNAKGVEIIADNGSSTFRGNFVQVGDGPKDYQAIYVGKYVDDTNSGIDLIARNGGVINLYDYIDGVEGYTVKIKGDGTGTLNLFNDIRNANVYVGGYHYYEYNKLNIILHTELNPIVVNMADGITHDYNFHNLISYGGLTEFKDEDGKVTVKEMPGARYILDIDFATGKSDTITVGEGSSGNITISGLNFLNMPANINETYRFKVLNTTTDQIGLNLTEELQEELNNKEYYMGLLLQHYTEKIKPDTDWDKIYQTDDWTFDVYGKIGLLQEGIVKDTIGVYVTRYEQVGENVFNTLGDTLSLWTSTDVEYAYKNFNFKTATDEYIVGKNYSDVVGLGKTNGYEHNINGVLGDEGKRSSINLNNRKGFEVVDNSDLNISNVEIRNASGGAIEALNEHTVNLTNVSFKNNKSYNNGAAIYSMADVNITADGAESEFTRNMSNATNEGIYIANADKKLTLNVINDGVLTFNDSINGKKGYTVDIKGDSTGTLNLYNNINNADITIDGVNVNLANNKFENYTFETLTSTENAGYTLDIDFNNMKADTITTAKDSSGTVTISGLRFENAPANPAATYEIKILNTQNDDLQLALSQEIMDKLGENEYKIGESFEDIYDEIKADTNWKDIYNTNQQQTDIYGKLGLASSEGGTTNDSIGIVVSRNEAVEGLLFKEIQGDTLALWNNLNTEGPKNFNFNSAQDEYIVGSQFANMAGLGKTKGDEININGILAKNGERSTINLNSYKGFEVNDPSTLNIDNVEISNANGGAIEVTNADAVVNLNNVSFKNNVSDTFGSAIYSMADVNITANNAASEFTGNKDAIYIANADKALNLNILNNGSITLNDSVNGEKGYTVNITGDQTGTLNLLNDINDANVVVDTVKVNMADGKTHNYTFESLTSNENANYALDIDFANNQADKITVTGNASGKVTISELNILNGSQDTLEKDYKTQILDTQTNALQLALSDEVKVQFDKEYNYGKTSKYSSDDIETTTQWDQKYKVHNEIYDVTGKLDLTTTKTENDSIGMILNERYIETIHGEQGDTLALWSNLDTTEAKHFNFDSADNVYVVTDLEGLTDLGETKGSELNINGVAADAARSTIDLNARKGFEVKQALTLNLNNVDMVNGNNGALKVNAPGATINLTNTSFKNNISTTQGGAIWTDQDLNIVADNSTLHFEGNVVKSDEGNDDNAIYVADAGATLNFSLKNNGEIVLKDNIRGAVEAPRTRAVNNASVNAYKVNIQGDSLDTAFHMHNNMYNADLTVGNTTVNTLNNAIQTYNLHKLTLSNDVNFLADVDLEKKEMDHFTANEYGQHTGNLNLIGLNLLSDAPESDQPTALYFAQPELKNNVVSKLTQAPHPDYQLTAFAPIYKYDVTYDNQNEYDGKGDGGYFLFTRHNGKNESDDFNPAVLASPVAAQLGGYLMQLNSYEEAFRNMDMYTLQPEKQRQAILKARHAQANPSWHNKGFEQAWISPRPTMEKVSLRNGPRVSNSTYGTFFGTEADLYDLGNEWNATWGIYAGYNGAHQNYDGVRINENGVALGTVGMAYRGNFFTGLTVNAGVNETEAKTMYGRDRFAMRTSGIASKTGYNVEMKDGKFIFQPNLLMSYSYVNTANYQNAADVKITSRSLHAVQLEPGLKFIASLPNNWQPYVGVSMVWNLMDKTYFKANDVLLPKLSVKPFVKYGFGARKIWKDRFTGFLQSFFTNGGRDGVGLQAGFQFSFGGGQIAENTPASPLPEQETEPQEK